jgi:hypothetical protein
MGEGGREGRGPLFLSLLSDDMLSSDRIHELFKFGKGQFSSLASPVCPSPPNNPFHYRN